MSFVKTDPAPLEAAGLRWLAEAGARVPEILSESPGRLEMEEIRPGQLDAAGEEELGRMLATMHAAGARPLRHAAGSRANSSSGVASSNRPRATTGTTYYLQHRCLPLAERVGFADVVARVRVEAPIEPPARLHGDLWSGNVLADRDGRPWLIDPAAYGGHREMDLAMLDLFGRIPDRTVAAYEEVAPLADGWRSRIGLWQLFPLLVHAVLFGGGYLRRSHDLAVRLS